MKLQSINPATEELMAEFDYLSPDEVTTIVKKLHGNTAWPTTDISERAEALRRLARELEHHKQAHAELITTEMGKPITQSLAEIEKCAWLCNYYADSAESFLQPEFITTDFRKSYIRLDPLGVVLGVMPWNFPFWQVFRFAVPTLLVGNRVAVKHASNVPQSATAIEEIFSAALPDHTYKNLFLSGRDTSSLIESPYVDAVSITGSTAAGAKVAEAAGRAIKKTVLELGGSDPFIILADADIEQAATAAATARFINAGQSCIAAKRFIVITSIAKEFQKCFAEKVQEKKMGDPLDKQTDIGPLARGDLRTGLHDIVVRTVQQGATIVTGGKPREGTGFFYEPTLVTNVTTTMPALTEETFGPVAPIILVNTPEEAVRLANQSDYGLGASLWTADTSRAEQLAQQIESGFVAINAIVKSDPRLPFGGVKKSGYGRELSHHALREFANIKTVVVA